MKNCFIIRLRWRVIFYGLVILLSPHFILGQICVAPSTAFTTSSTDALCLGSGTVTVSGVTGGSGSFEYQLIHSSNAGLNKPWQTSPNFISVSSGSYEVQVRSTCMSGTTVYSSVVTQPVIVGGNYETLELGVTATPTCATDGTITVTATKGYLAPGSSYRYALVPTLNEPEPVSNYTRSPQTSNVFTGLTPGTHYVRVYDDCSNYASFRTVETYIGSYANTNALFNISRVLDYCSTDYLVTNPLSIPGGTLSVVYPDGTEEGLRVSGLDTIPLTVDKFSTSPANFSLKFTDICGNFRLYPYVYDSLELDFVAERYGAVGCDSTSYLVRLDAHSPNWPDVLQNKPIPHSYSIDNGPIISRNSGVYFFLPNDGSPHQIIVSACNLTDTLTIQGALPPSLPVIEVSEGNAGACEGMSGLYLRSADGTNFTIEFLTVPAGQGPMPPQYWSELFYNNILPGTYSFVVYNNCFRDTLSMTLSHPFQKSVSLTESAICTAGSANINISITTNGYAAFNEAAIEFYKISIYNSSNTLVRQNTLRFDMAAGTGSTHQFSYPFTLSTGAYRIEVKKDIYNANCSAETDTITIKGTQPITLDQLLATSFCPTEGFTVVQAAGGVGPYQYTLYENSIAVANKLAGPQAGNAFTGLDPNKIYHVAATDQCGSGINIQTQFSTVPITTALNAGSKDCLGGHVQIEVYSLPGAAYQWYKDNVIIPGATNPTYVIPALSNADLGSYKVFVTVGTCDDFTTDLVLTGTECTPFPVKISAFTANKEGNSALLNWSTTFEDHSERFEIQHSMDARNWATEGAVQAKGNSSAITHYTYNHRSPQNGINYYRLKMIDQDGSSALSSIKNVRFELAPALTIYPNPTVDKIRLEGTDLKKITGIAIYDLNGHELQFRPNLTDGIVDLKQLSSGTYIIQVKYLNGLTNSQKIVVIR